MELSPQILGGWLEAFATEVAENEPLLTDLDRQIGDADHGANMVRGTKAVAALDPADFADARSYAKKVAMTLISTVGGASGPLYGTFFLRLAAALPDDGPIGQTDWLQALRAGVQGVLDRGKANPGDKTMLDALVPAARALQAAVDAGQPMAAGLRQAALAAAEGARATIDMKSKSGRASWFADRTVGAQDPGATAVQLMFESLASFVEQLP